MVHGSCTTWLRFKRRASAVLKSNLIRSIEFGTGSSTTFETGLNGAQTILESFCAATKIILDRTSFHTQERLSRRDFFDGTKLRCADL